MCKTSNAPCVWHVLLNMILSCGPKTQLVLHGGLELIWNPPFYGKSIEMPSDREEFPVRSRWCLCLGVSGTTGKSESCSVRSYCLWPYGLYSPWNSPGQNDGVGSLSLLQGIVPIQGSNPGLPNCRWILNHLSHKGRSRILEWAAHPFFSRSSQPRNLTRISCIAGRFFTNWAIREAYGTTDSESKHLNSKWVFFYKSHALGQLKIGVLGPVWKIKTFVSKGQQHRHHC